MFGSIAIENIIEGYKAQFKPDKSGLGYRYFSNSYGDGIPLSTEQYTAYVTEFESFVNRSQRFMFRWTLGMMLVLIVVMVAALTLLDSEVLTGDQWGYIGAGLFVLPLIYFFYSGYELRKKPLRELVEENPGSAAVLGVQRKRSFEERFDQNLLGISPQAISMGIGVGLLGMVVSGYEFINKSQFKPLYLVFPAVIVMFAAIGWRRKKIKTEEAKILLDQAQLSEAAELQDQIHYNESAELHNPAAFKIDRAQKAWLTLNQRVVHSCAARDVENSVLSVAIPAADTDAYRDADPYAYFHQIMTAFDRDLPNPSEGVFLLSMDWKEAVSDYEWKLNSAVATHPKIAAALSLPEVNRYPSNASILYEGVLGAVVAALDQAGLRQVFIDDLSDTYYVLLINTHDTDAIAQILADLHMGYRFDFPH